MRRKNKRIEVYLVSYMECKVNSSLGGLMTASALYSILYRELGERVEAGEIAGRFPL